MVDFQCNTLVTLRLKKNSYFQTCRKHHWFKKTEKFIRKAWDLDEEIFLFENKKNLEKKISTKKFEENNSNIFFFLKNFPEYLSAFLDAYEKLGSMRKATHFLLDRDNTNDGIRCPTKIKKKNFFSHYFFFPPWIIGFFVVVRTFGFFLERPLFNFFFCNTPNFIAKKTLKRAIILEMCQRMRSTLWHEIDRPPLSLQDRGSFLYIQGIEIWKNFFRDIMTTGKC